VFAQEADRATCLKAQGLTGDRPILLQLAGGLGVGPIAEIYQNLLALEMPVEVVVVAGKNAAVKMDLEQVKVPARHRAKVIGFTDQIDQLMAVADVVVSKPGGLTTSEVLARGAAMAVVNPIPGQESRNSDFLLENGAAIKINNLATLTHKLGLLLQDPARLAGIKANAKRLGRPQAATEICRLALRLAWDGGFAQ
jgi:processive 1,2-diacylglycerol beta-glucosyltransferase